MQCNSLVKELNIVMIPFHPIPMFAAETIILFWKVTKILPYEEKVMFLSELKTHYVNNLTAQIISVRKRLGNILLTFHRYNNDDTHECIPLKVCPSNFIMKSGNPNKFFLTGTSMGILSV